MKIRDILPKEDSPEKLQAAQGKPEKNFIFAPEFNAIVEHLKKFTPCQVESFGNIVIVGTSSHWMGRTNSNQVSGNWIITLDSSDINVIKPSARTLLCRVKNDCIIDEIHYVAFTQDLLPSTTFFAIWECEGFSGENEKLLGVYRNSNGVCTLENLGLKVSKGNFIHISFRSLQPFGVHRISQFEMKMFLD